MSKRLLGLVAASSMVVLSVQARAASVIDTATKTAITGGFTDLKDTLLDLVATGFPFIIAGAVVLASPQIVKGLLHLASKR